MKLWIPITVIFMGMLLLLATTISAKGIPEVPVRDLTAGDHDGREIKLQGVLKKVHKATRPLKFDVCDREDPAQIVQIEVDDVRPDVFEEGKDIAVIGIFDANTRTMSGTKIFTKCPSKYEESQEPDSSGDPEPPPAPAES